jgi:hypothetical protein
VVTADTYTSVLPQIQRRCADATAQLVLNAARRTRKKIKTKARTNRPGRGPKTGAPAPVKPKQVLPPLPRGSRPLSRRSQHRRPTKTPFRRWHPRRTHVTPTVRTRRTAERARAAFPRLRPLK